MMHCTHSLQAGQLSPGSIIVPITVLANGIGTEIDEFIDSVNTTPPRELFDGSSFADKVGWLPGLSPCTILRGLTAALIRSILGCPWHM